VRPNGELVELDIQLRALDLKGGRALLATGRDNTDIRHALNELRKSEERYRTLFEHSGDGILIHDTEGRIVEANRQICETIGYTRDELLKLHIADLQAPNTKAGESGRRAVRKLQHEVFAVLETDFLKKSGEIIQGEVRSSAFELKGKTFYHAVFRDITERKRAQKALGDQKQRLDYIIEGTDIGTWEWNILTGETTFNERWAQMVGFTLDELSPISIQTWTNLCHPDDLAGSHNLLNECFKGEADYYECEMRMRHKNGDWIWVHQKGKVATWTAEGKPEWMFGTQQDISERRRAQERLAKSEARFRSYVESAPDGIFVIDENGRHVDANPAACRISGYTREELLGMSIVNFAHGDDRESALRHFEDAKHTGVSSGEFRSINKEGAVRILMIDVVQLSDTRYLCFSKDVTETREMESHLRQAQKMEAVGQLAGGIAHDFNNQLSGILGYADILRHDVANNEELVGHTDKIILSVKRAASLTAQLLAFSRKGKYQNTIVDIHRIVFEVVNILKHSIDKRIDISQELDANPCTTRGDPGQLQNAVLNLALNARDAMPNGGKLTIATKSMYIDEKKRASLQCSVTPGEYLRIRVTDTGEGMDEETQRRVFEPFFTTKRPGKGTGMGLAAVYGTVTNHGGCVMTKSAPGKGSTFSIYLPVCRESVDAPVKQSPVSRIGDNAHILLVEDENGVRDVVKRMLTMMGYRVTTCRDGVEAVEAYNRQWRKIDIVLLDVVMPRMDGEETFKALREINPNVIALVFSGYNLEGQAQRIVDMGARGFIQKPFRSGELIATLAKVLEPHSK
ncbi:MAG: PAS domain S-box protein, partial [Chitinivibrionales bacterium]|nr:PAS domain S-box protein [Chitinivibrionales bacterium]MBD3356459.1 PAS domain S-box protein [Chitinivibrionales bacterium]